MRSVDPFVLRTVLAFGSSIGESAMSMAQALGELHRAAQELPPALVLPASTRVQSLVLNPPRPVRQVSGVRRHAEG